MSPAFAQVTVLDAITIVATRTEEYAINALAAVSTIREEQIRELNPSRTHQIFDGVPGVSTVASAQEASTSVNIRGLQDFGRVAVLIDGARQNYARIGHQSGAGSFFLEPQLLADVDIVRGPTSNIYGSGAIGGVVAFRTKDVQDILAPNQAWGVQVNASTGTNGFNGTGSIFAAGRISPNAEVIIGGSLRDQSDYSTGNGTRIYNSGQEVQTFLAKATFRPADGHQIKAGVILYNADWVNGTPAGATLPPSTVTRDFNSVNTTATLNYKYRPDNSPLVDLDATLYWNRVDVDTRLRQYNVVPSATAFGIYGPVGTRTNYLIDTIGLDVNNTSRFETGALRHTLTYGADFFTDKVDNTATAGFGAGYNPRGERTVGGAFAQLRTHYSSWLEIITALRYDAFEMSGTDITTGNDVNNRGDRLSPKITIGVTPFTGFQPYVSYSEGYRAPAITETFVSQQHPGSSPFAAFLFIPNPNLVPEVGKNLEIGLNIKRDDLFVSGDKLRIKTSLFRNNVDNYIDSATVSIGTPGCPVVLVGFPPSPAFFFCSQYQNVLQARLEGFEFEGVYDRGDWFFGLSGHVINGKNLVNNGPLLNVPADTISTTVGARFLERKLSVAVRWSAVAAKKLSDLPAGTAPTAAVGSYNLVNLYVGYEINPTLQLAFSVENLLDEEYRIFSHEFASAGITAKLAIRKSFGPAPDLTAVNNVASRNLRPASLH